MSDYNIPTRPNGYDYKGIKKADCDCIAYKVLFKVPNAVAFALFHQEYTDMKGSLSEYGKQICSQFFNAPKHKEFEKAYKQTIEEFCKGKGGASVSEPFEKRKDKAVSKLVSDCLDAINDNKDLDPEVLKDFVTMAKALGVLKEEQDVQRPPIRVLIARCKSECRYRLCIESLKTEGKILDDCDYCKARRYAEERGFKYDPCTVLDVPQDMIDRIDSKNDVRLEDILDGRITN